jgi:hypothetical protein
MCSPVLLGMFLGRFHNYIASLSSNSHQKKDDEDTRNIDKRSRRNEKDHRIYEKK